MTVRIPAEWEPHSCCWMAWAVGAEWKTCSEAVKRELALVVRTISQFELVRLLTPPEQLTDCRARFSGGNIDVIEAPVDDIWMRDIAPVFALDDEEVVAIDLNFNGWGNTKERPARAGDRLAATAAAIFGVTRVCVPFVAEGGALIVDGEGTLITTESCLLNPNRNSFWPDGLQKRKIEQALAKNGISRVIWLKGDASEPITSGHVDGYALFTAPGALLVDTVDKEHEPTRWRAHDITRLENSIDATGRLITIERVRAPRKQFSSFDGPFWAPCYLNAYIAQGAVIAPCFGDCERDEAAASTFVRAFPGRRVEMLKIDHITSAGGGIRCLTQPMPVNRR
jgi:agmatine deiminase